MAVALVTGTSTGIGLATAIALARDGHEVYATMRTPERAPELAAQVVQEKLPVKILPMDVDSDASVARTVAEILGHCGRVDVLVNNAGISSFGAIEDLPLSEFRRVMETNYFGVLRCIQAVVPGMRERRSGNIINISSVAGRTAVGCESAYQASKWALEAISEALAQEVKAFGIHVSIVEPGVVATPIFGKVREVPRNTRYPQERRMNALFDAALKHPVSPYVVADKVVELIKSETWKLRHPTGPDAEGLLQYRASKTDEQWIALQALESDEEWAAVIKREIGVDVDLSK